MPLIVLTPRVWQHKEAPKTSNVSGRRGARRRTRVGKQKHAKLRFLQCPFRGWACLALAVSSGRVGADLTQ
eukprot:9060309-Lingulodinium_polyedra.AAC.1